MINKLFLLQLFLITSILLPAQINIKRSELISIQQGLPDRIIVDIIQDRAGFLWIATLNGLNRFVATPKGLDRFNGYSFTYYTDDPRNPKQIYGNNIKEIHEDRNNNIVIIYNNGYEFIDLLQTNTSKTKQLFLNPENGIYGKVKSAYVEKNGSIYILSAHQDSLIITRYVDDANFEPIIKIPKNDFSDPSNCSMLVSKDGSFWLPTDENILLKINRSKTTNLPLIQEYFKKSTSGPPQSLSILYEDKNNRLWVAFSDSPGIYLYQPDRNKFELYANLPDNEIYSQLWEDDLGNLLFKVPENEKIVKKIYCLNINGEVLDFSALVDLENKITVIYGKDFYRTLFMGTYVGMIKVVQNENLKNVLSLKLENGGAWGNVIKGITADNNGTIYIAKESKYWYQLDSFHNALPITNPNSGENIDFGKNYNLKFDPAGFIWGTSEDDARAYLNRLDTKTKTIKQYNYPIRMEDFILGNDGLLWLVCGQENKISRLISFNPQTQKFTTIHNKDGTNPLEKFHPLYMLESQNGLLWVGTFTGLLCIDRQKGTSSILKTKVENPKNSLSNNTILAIYEHPDGLLYLGTAGGGLNIFNPTTGEIKVYNEQNGLASNEVCGIVPDDEGNYWISTFNGLSHFDTRNEHFSNFYTENGLSHNEFNRFSFLNDSKGRYYFGGMNGVNIFRSEDLLKSNAHHPLCFTKFSKYNSKKQILSEEDSGLQNRNEVRISPYDTYFQFNFAIMDFSQPEKNQYKYWLQGYDESWSYLGNMPFVRFNKLPAGNYTLHIKAADSKGNWGEQPLRMEIRVGAFFYQTIWAYMLYAFLLLTTIYFVYKFQLNRKLEHAETKKLKELDQAKTRLYTNITHEFRTPLTLISGPAKKAISNIDTIDKGELLKDLKLITRNSQHLLRLVNQMLDLNKLDGGNMHTHFIKGDVIAYLKYIVHSFQTHAESKKIQLTFYPETDHLLIDYDKEKLFQILSNLLNNAFKFTGAGGQIIIHTGERDDQFFLTVKDTGVGIDPEHLPYIFNRFYQGDISALQKNRGAGIGLSLIQELVHLLGGTIRVESKINKGTTFLLSLPIHKNADLEEVVEYLPVDDIDVAAGLEKDDKGAVKNPVQVGQEVSDRQILIIEDNAEVAQYIANCLNKNYRLVFANNGQTGTDKALELVPDIIISDVMMPEKNGFEVCHELKNDQRTSHIPIILLTALADISSKIKGLKGGADAYLAKPFDENELLVRIEKLLELRNILQQKYSQSILNDDLIIKSIDQQEDVFLKNVKTIVEKYLTDHQFNMTLLCREVGMSRTQLHRKFTALTGESATKFVRSIRLTKAKALLLNPNLTVAEVAYETGFSDPNYFSRLFHQAYGCSPSEYQNK